MIRMTLADTHKNENLSLRFPTEDQAWVYALEHAKRWVSQRFSSSDPPIRELEEWWEDVRQACSHETIQFTSSTKAFRGGFSVTIETVEAAPDAA